MALVNVCVLLSKELDKYKSLSQICDLRFVFLWDGKISQRFWKKHLNFFMPPSCQESEKMLMA